MARSSLRVLLTVAGLLAASPALAQFPNIFDSLFGNPPPRPQQDIPRPPSDLPGGGRSPQYVPPPGGGGLPPGPPPGRIQTQPLPPPPGGTAARPQQGAPGQQPGQRPGQQQQPPQQQQASLPPPSNETIVEPPPHKMANPTAVFSGLDKITGRIISFDVAINETVRFGALEVTPKACYSRPPTEQAATDAFVEVDELTLQGELKRIFSGWMFAASPGLNAVEHPIYDVWLTDCKGAQPPPEAPVAVAPAPAQPRARPQQPRPPGQPPQQRAQQPLPPPPAPPAR